MYVLSLTQQYI